jgi:hypothetical protein
MLTQAKTECHVHINLSKRSSTPTFILIPHFTWRFKNMAILNFRRTAVTECEWYSLIEDGIKSLTFEVAKANFGLKDDESLKRSICGTIWYKLSFHQGTSRRGNYQDYACECWCNLFKWNVNKESCEKYSAELSLTIDG